MIHVHGEELIQHDVPVIEDTMFLACDLSVEFPEPFRGFLGKPQILEPSLLQIPDRAILEISLVVAIVDFCICRYRADKVLDVAVRVGTVKYHDSLPNTLNIIGVKINDTEMFILQFLCPAQILHDLFLDGQMIRFRLVVDDGSKFHMVHPQGLHELRHFVDVLAVVPTDHEINAQLTVPGLFLGKVSDILT